MTRRNDGRFAEKEGRVDVESDVQMVDVEDENAWMNDEVEVSYDLDK